MIQRNLQEHCKASTETLHDGNSLSCSVCMTCKVPSQGLQMAGKQEGGKARCEVFNI